MIFVGICGPSNSGKSTLCKELAKKYDSSWIELDHYLKDIKDIPLIGKYRNWELPQNHRFDLLLKNLRDLDSGKSINYPVYDFKEGKIKEYRKVSPKEIIFVEGFFLFSDKKVRDLLDIKIYLDIPTEEFLKRRVCTEEEGDWTKRDYVKNVCIPMYKKYGITQKKYADSIIDATAPIQEVKKKVENILNKSFKN